MPVSASIEPACAPKTSGIRSCEGGRFSRTASTTTTGRSAATAPLTLMSAESTPQKSIISTISRKRLAPEPRASICPVQAVRPVFSSAPADHEERGDEDRRRVAEAGERLVEREDAGRPERHGAADADGDDRQPVPDEEADDAGDDGEDDPDLGQGSPRHRTGGGPPSGRVSHN